MSVNDSLYNSRGHLADLTVKQDITEPCQSVNTDSKQQILS